jgi:ABC-type polysaccharide/polyol phosphate transport system ATPase subunit
MTAIKVQNLTKVYPLYASPTDRLKELFHWNGKQYHRDFYALNDVSFHVEKGQTVGIIGQNGSGKSTLLRIICSVLQPTRGSVQVEGRISALLELGAGFNPEFTGRENVYMNGALMGLSRAEMERRFPEIAAFAEIGTFMDQPVKTYSSGMYVRLAFAAAIHVDPEILIVDEALAVGDAKFQFKCFLKFQELQERKKTILFVSHDLNTVKKYCSRAILFNQGRPLFEGDPNEAVNRYIEILFPGGDDSPPPEESVARLASSIATSKKEYRYGSGTGEIASITLKNSRGEETHLFTSGEEMTILFQAVVSAVVEKPILAMGIKDLKGQDLYGTNTHFQGIMVPPLAAGDRVEVSFRQRLTLIANTYFISLGFVHLDNGTIIPLDRRYDVIEITVLAKSGDLSFGLANLESQIQVRFSPHQASSHV